MRTPTAPAPNPSQPAQRHEPDLCVPFIGLCLNGSSDGTSLLG